MVIQRDAWSVGSLSTTDPNAQSFQSPNWRHSGEKRPPPHEAVAVEDDVVTISSHPPFPLRNSAATFGLINAISFSQTQDGFLRKVQESLQRMSELSVMAQSEAKSEAERQDYTAEFTQLQTRIREIENKMFKAAHLFRPSPSETGLSVSDPQNGSQVAPSLHNEQVNECLDDSSNPDCTMISNAQKASAAVHTIHDALEAIANLRARVIVDIQRLNSRGEELSAMDLSPSRSDLQIRDGHVAEESTRFLRRDILVQSGSAMLAQANALPQSALRLLG